MPPSLKFSEELHAEKYRGTGETFRESVNRVASALQDNEEHFRLIKDIFEEQRFMPAGRVQAAMGSTKNVTAYNCFVSGTIEDSFVEGKGSIMARATEAAETMRCGGGIGYDFSTLRPRGSLIKKLESRSSGPISFMEIFDAVCKCVASSGHRRGAQMGVMRVDHPDIEEFIHVKNDLAKLNGFNISVAITDVFMDCLQTGEPFELAFDGVVHKEVNAQALWDQIMRSTWDYAEPGVLFIDTINKWNNLEYAEQIVATNPCGEQPLPPFGACLLGSFNLVQYVTYVEDIGVWEFNYDQFREDIPPVVRAMDNVVDRAIYPLEAQAFEAKDKRRMGLGVTGLANAVEVMGHPYGSEEFLNVQRYIMTVLRDSCYEASIELAKEKGSFPLYSETEYPESAFIRSLPFHIQHNIRLHGIRNSHLLSVAPTGTISLTADNVSSGIEPVFAYSFERTIQTFEGPKVETVTDYGVREFEVKGKRSADVTVQEHLAVLSLATELVDSAVSKTCNVPGDVSWEDFKQVYIDAYEAGCKGCTTFRSDGKRTGILVADDDETETDEGSACYVDPVTGRHECE